MRVNFSRSIAVGFLSVLVLLSVLATGNAGYAEQTQEPPARPKVEIRTTEGRIIVELYATEAPLSVANFLNYVDWSFYDGTIFHRVKPNFMIQGGGFTPDLEMKETDDPVRNESRNHMHNERGTLAMARTNDPHSATSQFFINVRSNLRLDFNYVTRELGYTVFGKVIDGMDVVDAIALVPTGSVDGLDDVPLDPVIIESVKRLE